MASVYMGSTNFDFRIDYTQSYNASTRKGTFTPTAIYVNSKLADYGSGWYGSLKVKVIDNNKPSNNAMVLTISYYGIATSSPVTLSQSYHQIVPDNPFTSLSNITYDGSGNASVTVQVIQNEDSTPSFYNADSHETVYAAKATLSNTAQLTPHPTGIVYISNGTTFEQYQCYIYDGSGWSMYAPYIYNGSSWDQY